MGMEKRDIAFAYCGLYLLAWLIRNADPERYHIMKERLQTILNTLDDEDKRTSEGEPDPKWRHLFERKKP